MSSPRVYSPMRGLGFDAGEAIVESVAAIEAANRAPVRLADPVAVNGIVEEIGEVIKRVATRSGSRRR